MARMTEWVEVDATESTPVPVCPKSINKHRWIMTIENGNSTFSIDEGDPCVMHDFGTGAPEKVCEWNLADWISQDPDAVEMQQGVRVNLTIQIERSAEDVYGWLDVEPKAAMVEPKDPNDLVVLRGTLGWGNPTAGELNHNLDTYGPLGRWHNEGRTQGHRLADALVTAGMSEGAAFVVVATNRFGDNEALDRVVEMFQTNADTPEA